MSLEAFTNALDGKTKSRGGMNVGTMRKYMADNLKMDFSGTTIPLLKMTRGQMRELYMASYETVSPKKNKRKGKQTTNKHKENN